MTSTLPVTQMTSRPAALSNCTSSLRQRTRALPSSMVHPAGGPAGRNSAVATAVNTTFSTYRAMKSRLSDVLIGYDRITASYCPLGLSIKQRAGFVWLGALQQEVGSAKSSLRVLEECFPCWQENPDSFDLFLRVVSRFCVLKSYESRH